jgi:HPt (histidine-containing phosphotransfer) domain-containing protein
MHSSSTVNPAACAPARVLVAATAPLRMEELFPAVRFDFVDSADIAVEQAMASDYEIILLDLALAGIGAVAAADILRRAGAPCTLVALGEFAVGDMSSAMFDHCLASPVSSEALRALIAAMRPPSRLAVDMAGDWIGRECADLVAEFRAGLPAAAAALRAALEERDMVALKALVHALKGSAGAYGFATATQQCAKIESGIRAGHIDAVSADTASLVDGLEREFAHWQAHG